MPNETKFVVDHRRYPIGVLIRYAEETRERSEEERDVVVEQRSFYTDAILRALRFGAVTYPTGVYHHEWAGSEKDPTGPAGLDTEGMTIHRSLFLFDFWTLFDPNELVGGGGTEDDATSVVIDGGSE